MVFASKKGRDGVPKCDSRITKKTVLISVELSSVRKVQQYSSIVTLTRRICSSSEYPPDFPIRY